MKLTLFILFCVAASALGMHIGVKDTVDKFDTFGLKNILNKGTLGTNNVLFYKMIFGDKYVDLVLNEMTVEEKLTFDLLKVYNKHVNPPGVTNLKFATSLLVIDVNKMTGLMKGRAVENYMWKDLRLTWNPTEYKGITEIRIPAKKIWTPDMKLFNSLFEEEIRDEVNLIIKNDGGVLYFPMVTYKTLCLESGGQGVFKCKLILGSWTYHNEILKLTPDTVDKVKDKLLMYIDEMSKFDITGVKVMVKDLTYPESPNQLYSALHLEFNVIEKVGHHLGHVKHFDLNRGKIDRDIFDPEFGGDM